MWVLILLGLVATALAQLEGDYLRLKTCDASDAAQQFELHYEVRAGIVQ